MASPRCTPNCSKASVFQDFYELWPERFSNKTNGVTPRRFAGAVATPALRELLDRTVGERMADRSGPLRGLEPLVDDAAFRGTWRAVKHANKARLASLRPERRTGVALEPGLAVRRPGQAHPRVQAPALNVLHIVALYHRLKQNPALVDSRRAPSSSAARPRPATTWPSASSADQRRRRDGQRRPGRRPALKVAFVPNFSVPNAQLIYPGRRSVRADLHRGQGGLGHRQHEVQLNGALTIGTLDGANVEIREEVGPRTSSSSA